MKKLLSLYLLIGISMISNASSALQNFDKFWNFDNPAETEIKFRELLPLAEKSGDLDYKLQLQTQIARTQGLQRKFVEAHRTLDEVKSALTKNTVVAEIRYDLERGRVFNSSKEQTTALSLFQKAFDLAVSQEQDNLAIDAAHMIAIAEPQPEMQMEWNLRAVGLAERSVDPTARRWLGSLYNNIGWTYHESGKFSEALVMFEKALAFREKQGESTSIRIAKWSIARTYRSLNRIDEALAIQKSLEEENESRHEKDGYVFEELGELYLVKNVSFESKKYFALAYQELSKDEWFKANEAKRLQRIKELGDIH